MTNLQAGKPVCEEYSAASSGQHLVIGSLQKSAPQPSLAPRRTNNKTSRCCSTGLQETNKFTKPVSNREQRYHLRRPLSTDLMVPPIPMSPVSHSAQDWDREQLEHSQKESHGDDRTNLEEISQQNGQKYPDIQATVEDDPDTPISFTGEGSPNQDNLHQHEYTEMMSPSSISSVETEIISPEIVHRYHRQIELFQSIERICSAAVQTYWRSQCDSSFFKPLVLRSPRLRRNQRESLPYPTGRILSLPQHSLASYLSDIARNVWERAEGPAQELEAVYRMGNIYSWGEKVTRAARGELGIASKEDIFKVLIAALDLTSWMLCEEAKVEIVRILAHSEWALAR
ncbi:hypothetical protein MMC26_001386 [Xylographa opegraphella]|nr:hypothetical protein [Xylographa opegraphella]